MTVPFILVRDMKDVLVAPPTDLYIYNVKEFTSMTTVQVEVYAVDKVYNFLYYKSGILTQFQNPVAPNTVTKAPLVFLCNAVQGYETTLYLTVTRQPGHIPGSKVLFFYDNIVTQTLYLTVGSATISELGVAVGSCTSDAVTFFVSCILTVAPITSFSVILTSFPAPSEAISPTPTIVYQVLSVAAATGIVFDYSMFPVANYPTTGVPIMRTFVCDPSTPGQMTVTITTFIPVPAGGSIVIVLNS